MSKEGGDIYKNYIEQQAQDLNEELRGMGMDSKKADQYAANYVGQYETNLPEAGNQASPENKIDREKLREQALNILDSLENGGLVLTASDEKVVNELKRMGPAMFIESRAMNGASLESINEELNGIKERLNEGKEEEPFAVDGELRNFIPETRDTAASDFEEELKGMGMPADKAAKYAERFAAQRREANGEVFDTYGEAELRGNGVGEDFANVLRENGVKDGDIDSKSPDELLNQLRSSGIEVEELPAPEEGTRDEFVHVNLPEIVKKLQERGMTEEQINEYTPDELLSELKIREADDAWEKNNEAEEKVLGMGRGALKKIKDIASKVGASFPVMKEWLLGSEDPENDPEIKKRAKEALEKNIPKWEWPGFWKGMVSMGFIVQEAKARFYKKAFDSLDGRFKDDQAFLARFISAYSSTYGERIIAARRSRDELLEKGGMLKHGMNWATLAGNLALYTRAAREIMTLNPLRSVTSAAMFFGGLGENVKKAHLDKYSVVEEGRVQDEGEAWEQAWELYNRAKKDGIEKPTSEDLSKQYKFDLAGDLSKRLEKESDGKDEEDRPGLISRAGQFAAKKYLAILVDRVYIKQQEIETSSLSPEEKKEQMIALEQKYDLFMRDMDRMIANSGKIDMISFGSRMVEKTGKGIAILLAAETLISGFQNFDKVFDIFGGGESADTETDVQNVDSDVDKENEEQVVPPAATTTTADESPVVTTTTGDAPNEQQTTTTGGDQPVVVDEKPEVGNDESEIVKDNSAEAAAAASQAEAVPEKYVFEVKKGSNIWNMIGSKLQEEGYFNELDKEGKKVYLIDAVMDKLANKTPEELRAMNISSGDIDILRDGEKINLSSIFDSSIKELANEAKVLNEDAVSRIEGLSAPDGQVEISGQPGVAPFDNEKIPFMNPDGTLQTETVAGVTQNLPDSFFKIPQIDQDGNPITPLEGSEKIPYIAPDGTFTDSLGTERNFPENELFVNGTTEATPDPANTIEVPQLSHEESIAKMGGHLDNIFGKETLLMHIDGTATPEWISIKDRLADDFMKAFSPDSTIPSKDPAEVIEKNKKLAAYLSEVVAKAGRPLEKETIEQFLMRNAQIAATVTAPTK